jgi:hypothetical protein
MGLQQLRAFARALLVGLGLLSTLPLHAAAPASKEPATGAVVVTYFFLPG